MEESKGIFVLGTICVVIIGLLIFLSFNGLSLFNLGLSKEALVIIKYFARTILAMESGGLIMMAFLDRFHICNEKISRLSFTLVNVIISAIGVLYMSPYLIMLFTTRIR